MKLAMCLLFTVSGASAQFMPEQIAMIMSASKVQENRAERHQAKMVEKTRQSVEKSLRAEAEAITDEFAKYVAEVHSAETVLEAAVNATEAALKAEKSKQKPGTWDSKGAMDRARLGADVGSAKQVLTHEQHQDKRALRKAEHVAEGVIGGEVDKLGMKLGDLSSIAKEVDEQLEEHVRQATQQVLKDNQTFTSPQADYSPAGPTHLSELNQDLGKAEKASAAGAAGANKRLNDFLTKVSAEVANMGDKALSDVSQKEKQEMIKAFGHAAPQSKVSKESKAVVKVQQKPKAEPKVSPHPKELAEKSVKGPVARK